MHKKLLVLLILLLIIFNVNISFAYTDTQNHWAEKQINNFSVNGIISGYLDNTFRPNNNMTRAELVSVINRLLSNKVQSTKYVPDINSKDWYYIDVKKAIASGILEGDASGNVRPNDLITREEAICIIQRAIVPLSEDSIVPKYSDYEDVAKWARGAVNTFIQKKYINGYKDNTIRPKDNITRAEVVTIISNIINHYISYGEFNGNLHGNVIVRGDKVKFNNITIHGDLIIAEGGTDVSFKDVIIEGNFIYRRDVEIPSTKFKVNGKTYDMKPVAVVDESKYENDDYGISFSIPTGAKVIYIENEKEKINYKTKNLMTVRIRHSDDLYFTSFASGVFKERYRFSLPYEEITQGTIGFYKYAIYGYEKDNSYFLYIKRDNVEYVIYFYNIENINVVENVIDSIVLFEGTKIENHTIKTYRNPELFLKFNYVDYVSVDDSYNTGIVNEDNSFYKLFIQVTNIIDLSNYSLDQLQIILESLEDTSSEIIESKIKKVYTYDAIEYTVKNGEKVSKSLYIVISTKLYHFIFTSDEIKMESAGEEIYNDIINNIEFQ